MTPWPVDLFKTILGQVGGTADENDSLTITLRKIITAEGGISDENDGPVRLLKIWLDAIGGTSLYSDTAEATLKKILAAYGGSPNYNRNMRQTAEAIATETLAPRVISALVITDGAGVRITFSQAVTGGMGGLGSVFFITVNGGDQSGIAYSSGEGTAIYEFDYEETPIAPGDVVLLSYSPGDIANEDGKPLATFSDFPVTNAAAVTNRTTSTGDTRTTSAGDIRVLAA